MVDGWSLMAATPVDDRFEAAAARIARTVAEAERSKDVRLRMSLDRSRRRALEQFEDAFPLAEDVAQYYGEIGAEPTTEREYARLALDARRRVEVVACAIELRQLVEPEDLQAVWKPFAAVLGGDPLRPNSIAPLVAGASNSPQAPSQNAVSQTSAVPAPVQRFLVALADIRPRDRLSVFTSVAVDDYERSTAAGRQAIDDIRISANDYLPAALAATEAAVNHAFRLQWPGLQTLRDDLRALAQPGTPELPQDFYVSSRNEIGRRTLLAALALTVHMHLSYEMVRMLYRPFEHLLPLADILPSTGVTHAGQPTQDQGVATGSWSASDDQILRQVDDDWRSAKRSTAWAVAAYLVLLFLVGGFGWWSEWMALVVLIPATMLIVVRLIRMAVELGNRRRNAQFVAALPPTAGVIEAASPGERCVECGAPATHRITQAQIAYCRSHSERVVRLGLIAAGH